MKHPAGSRSWSFVVGYHLGWFCRRICTALGLREVTEDG
jgi:hypothetical protein